MSGWFNQLMAGFQNQNLDTARNDLFPPDDPARIWRSGNPVGTETLQSAGMPQPTTYAGPVGQFIDPQTGQMTAQGQARMDNPALGFDTGGIGGMARRASPLRVFHGSMENLDAFDPTRVGSGAMEGRWAAAAKHADEYYMTTDREHASTYGPNINEFEINKPLLKKNGKAELTAWAKDQGYKSAQHQLDEYYGGDIYDAMDLDNYLKDALREAKSSGFPGVHVSFGDLKARFGNRKVPVGDFVVLHDPSVATKVSP